MTIVNTVLSPGNLPRVDGCRAREGRWHGTDRLFTELRWFADLAVAVLGLSCLQTTRGAGEPPPQPDGRFPKLYLPQETRLLLAAWLPPRTWAGDGRRVL